MGGELPHLKANMLLKQMTNQYWPSHLYRQRLSPASPVFTNNMLELHVTWQHPPSATGNGWLLPVTAAPAAAAHASRWSNCIYGRMCFCELCLVCSTRFSALNGLHVNTSCFCRLGLGFGVRDASRQDFPVPWDKMTSRFVQAGSYNGNDSWACWSKHQNILTVADGL